MRTLYEVVEEYDSGKNYQINITPTIARYLSQLKKGEKIEPRQFIKQNIENATAKATPKSAEQMIYKGLTIGRKIGLLKNIKIYPISFKDFCKLESVEYCASQLKGTNYKHLTPGSNDWSTRKMYLYKLWNFNNWLLGQTFEFSRMLMTDSDTFKKQSEKIKLEGLEHLLRLLKESYNSDSDFIKIIKRYLLDPVHSHKRASGMTIIHSAIRSYFETNDCPLSFKFNPKTRYKTTDDEDEKPSLTLDDFFKILTVGKPSITQKAMYLCKFHRGLDSSTLADRFNFQAWPQLVKWFGTENHKSWDLEKIPVPIKLTRIKTSFAHIGFLDRDAVVALQDYLEYRHKRTGSEMRNDLPLFLNKNKEAITTRWVREGFSKLAAKAGIQHRLTGYTAKYSKDTHEMRDLLKSTLISCGTRYDVADHVIGHKPKDSYEKQAILYPENLRLEFMKGSRKLNVFSNISHYMKGDEHNEALLKKIDHLKQELEENKSNIRQERKEKEKKLLELERKMQKMLTEMVQQRSDYTLLKARMGFPTVIDLDEIEAREQDDDSPTLSW